MLRSMVAALACSCATAPPAPVTTTSAELVRDAEQRATLAESVTTRTKSDCEEAKRELDKLRERDNFEQSIWIRLEQADLTVHLLADLLPRGTPEQKKTIQRAIGESLGLRAAVERRLRRVHAVSDSAWRAFERETSAAMDDLERALTPLL